MSGEPRHRPPEYHLDGSSVTGERDLYAALGRALRAPDGYYGRNLDALADCLRGGYGPEPPFTLVWHHAAAARRVLGRRLERAGGGERDYFTAVVEVLREAGVTVRLE
ncbi:barstar family protein [Kitasatospora camelliae]|uniref:Barstar family protein n=1 Tax=Kitasatospora camelliae TaxID=3156397 RepID=A0AAU8JWK4_9ACTN